MSSRVQLPSAKRRRLAGGRPTTATSAINATDAASAVSPTSATPAIHGDKVHQDNFQRRSFSDRKAALNLAQMSQSDAPVSANKVDNLIATLTVSNFFD